MFASEVKLCILFRKHKNAYLKLFMFFFKSAHNNIGD